MQEFFVRILSLSASAGVIAALVALFILAQSRMPGRTRCVLWSLVGLRLLLPSSLGELLPRRADSGRVSTAYNAITLRTAAVVSQINASPSPAEGSVAAAAATAEKAPLSLGNILLIVWLLGVGVMLSGILISYIRLWAKLRTATYWGENVYQCDCVPSPFVYGLLNPRIYLPYSVPKRDIPYVLAHETTHIKRKDHIVKALAMLALSFHWFNPLLWLAFKGLCRDIELACDETAINSKTRSERQRYSAALLACSVANVTSLCPVAFGEIGVKERIINIMNNSKPKTLTKLVSVIMCIVVAVSVLLLPVGCNEKNVVEAGGTKASNFDSYMPAVKDSIVRYEENGVEFIQAEEIDRLQNDDGTVAMFYNSLSNCASDNYQEIMFNCSADYSAKPEGGTVMVPNENQRLMHLVVPTTVEVAAGASAYWIPTECEVEDGDYTAQVKKSVLTFTAADGSDTAVITVTADAVFSVDEAGASFAALPADATAESFLPQLVYTFSADENHVLTVDGNNTIIISHR